MSVVPTRRSDRQVLHIGLDPPHKASRKLDKSSFTGIGSLAVASSRFFDRAQLSDVAAQTRLISKERGLRFTAVFIQLLGLVHGTPQ
jgi:hypothetical protein